MHFTGSRYPIPYYKRGVNPLETILYLWETEIVTLAE